MRTVLRAMPAYLRVSMAVMLQYRGEIVLWAIWGVVYPAVAIAMWSAAVAGNPGKGSIGGFTPSEFAGYFLLTMVVGHLTAAWDVYEMGYLVRTGRMSPRLLRPLLPVWQSLSDNFAYKILTLAILIPIWLVIGWLTGPSFLANRAQLAWSIPAVALSGVLSFVWGYNLALLAFWITRMEAVGWLWFGGNLFFGGRLAPLTIMPDPLQKVASALPFKWMIWFPSASLLGKLKPASIQSGIVNQLCWLGLGLIVFRVMWWRGVRRYSAVGA
jgi:ABC-2 type transport system permease protein